MVRGNTPGMRELALDEGLANAGIEVTVADLADEAQRETLREASFVADAGITTAEYGIAETGTLAVLAGRGQGRAVSLLPPVHVVWVPAGRVFARLEDALLELEAELPAAVGLHSGPSKSADIGRTVVTGVHGPGRCIAVLS